MPTTGSQATRLRCPDFGGRRPVSGGECCRDNVAATRSPGIISCGFSSVFRCRRRFRSTPCTAMQRELDMKSRVREIRKPGSVGARGEQSPRATRLAPGKLGKGGRASNSETFRWNPAGNQSRLETLGQRPEASLAWGRATYPAKRRQLGHRPCDRAPKTSVVRSLRCEDLRGPRRSR